MKDKINLLPGGAKGAPFTKAQIYFILTGVIIFMGSFGIFYAKQDKKINKYQGKIDKLYSVRAGLQTELDAFKERYGEISTLQKKFDDIKHEIDIHKKVRFTVNKVLWSKIIEELGRITPDNVWLTQFKSTRRANETFIILQGIARRNSEIAHLMSLMEESKFFKKMRFNYSREKFINNHRVIDFEIRVELNEYSKNIRKG